MSEDRRITELLGIDRDVITNKCAQASRFLLEAKLLGGKSTEEFLAFMETTFTEQERKFLAIGYITDKTDHILQSLPGLEKFVDETVTKHGMPKEMSDIIKESLGLNKTTH